MVTTVPKGELQTAANTRQDIRQNTDKQSIDQRCLGANFWPGAQNCN